MGCDCGPLRRRHSAQKAVPFRRLQDGGDSRGLIMNESSRSKGVKNVVSLQLARERTRQAKAASDRQISKRSNQRLLERRMHSFGTVWWSSCLRFKRCTMVPNSSCRHLADFDDDTLAKTWLHDVNTIPMKFPERTSYHLSGCSFRPVTPKKVVSGQSLRA